MKITEVVSRVGLKSESFSLCSVHLFVFSICHRHSSSTSRITASRPGPQWHIRHPRGVIEFFFFFTFYFLLGLEVILSGQCLSVEVKVVYACGKKQNFLLLYMPGFGVNRTLIRPHYTG